MKNDKNVVIKKTEREVITYAEMWHTSGCFLKNGQENPKGSAHQFMASIVFTAFTLEAYLNHIGPKIFRCWNDLESLSPKKKLNVIAELLKVKIDDGKRPWQTIKDLFQFRNDIAHGKSDTISEEETIPLEEFDDTEIKFIEIKWEKYGKQESNAIRAREDVEKSSRLSTKPQGSRTPLSWDSKL